MARGQRGPGAGIESSDILRARNCEARRLRAQPGQV